MADPREGPGGARLPPLFLNQTEARRTEKCLLDTGSPRYLRFWMTAPSPPRPNHLSQGLDPTLRTLYEAQRTRLLFT